MTKKNLDNLLSSLNDLGFKEIETNRKVCYFEYIVVVGLGLQFFNWHKYCFNNGSQVYIKTDFTNSGIFSAEFVLPTEIQDLLAEGIAELDKITGIKYLDATQGYWDSRISKRRKDFSIALYKPLFDAIDQALEANGITIYDIHNPHPWAELTFNDLGESISEIEPDSLKGQRLTVKLHLGEKIPDYFDESFYFRMGEATAEIKTNFAFALSKQLDYARKLSNPSSPYASLPTIATCGSLAYELRTRPLG
jgi:hypothetical protein